MTDQDIIDQLSFFDDWEQRYAFIIDLGKQLADFDAADCTHWRIEIISYGA